MKKSINLEENIDAKTLQKRTWRRLKKLLNAPKGVTRSSIKKPEPTKETLDNLKAENQRLKQKLLQHTADPHNNQLRSLLDIVEANFFWVSEDGLIMDCNHAHAASFHYNSKHDVIGKYMHELDSKAGLKQQCLESTQGNNASVIQNRETVITEEELLGEDGQIRTFLSHKSPVIENGTCTSIVGIALEITEEKRREASLRSKKNAAENANQAKTAFITNISHDLRAPLHALQGIIEQLEATTLDATQAEATQNIQKINDVLLCLVENVLLAARLEDKSLPLTHVTFNLEHLMQTLNTTFTLLSKKKGVKFICNCDALTHHHFHSDRNAISRILINLLQNALKFTQSGTITLTAKENIEKSGDSTLTLIVSDTGVGISKENIQKVFSRHYQQEDHKGQGLGLGLSITQHFIEMLDGSIHVESTPKAGSNFTVQLPVTPIVDRQSEQPVLDPRSLLPMQNPRILLVEDSPIIQKITKVSLDKLGSVSVIADSAEDALEQWQGVEFDLVLLDFGLPGMSGIEMLSHLSKVQQKTPIIALTGETDEATKTRCKALGVKAFLSKPLSQKTLMNAIATQLHDAAFEAFQRQLRNQ